MIEAIFGSIIVLVCMTVFGKTNRQIDEEEKHKSFY